MATTRERALDAAVDEVGEYGIRALTHARVDARAGLPKGSTSNWFRTRDALIAGLIAHVADAERQELPAPAPAAATAEDVVDMLARGVERLTVEHARRTRVRLALFLDSAEDPDLLAPLISERERFLAWATDLLSTVGAADPTAGARTLLACGNGLVFHRLTVDPHAEIRPTLAQAVRGAMLPAG